MTLRHKTLHYRREESTFVVVRILHPNQLEQGIHVDLHLKVQNICILHTFDSYRKLLYINHILVDKIGIANSLKDNTLKLPWFADDFCDADEYMSIVE